MNFEPLDNLIDLILEQPNVPYFFIAGGAIKSNYLNKEIYDYDLFSPEPKQLHKILSVVLGDSLYEDGVWFYKYKDAHVSLAECPETDADKTISEFDFADIAVAYDSSKKLHEHDLWKHSIDTKTINYIYPKEKSNPRVQASLIRVMLRLKDGWSIDAQTAANFVSSKLAKWQATKFESGKLGKRKEIFDSLNKKCNY